MLICRFEPYPTHHMYNVSRIKHDLYGKTVVIEIEENGTYSSPFQACSQAKLLRQNYLAEGAAKVKILVNNEILTIQELENWAKKEYEFLPKCHACGNILHTQVYTHPLCQNNLFCSQKCADMDYNLMNEKMLDEVEIDYL